MRISFLWIEVWYDMYACCSFSQQVNGSPYEGGWIIKVKVSDAGELNSLMDDEKYAKFCEEEDSKH
jgi:hypothetical protein